jgi:hypothetical protein
MLAAVAVEPIKVLLLQGLVLVLVEADKADKDQQRLE